MSPEKENHEFHVAGVVIYARTEMLATVIEALEALSGAQIHGVSDDGKIVLTFESDTASHIAEQLSVAQRIPDVISVAPVYQHSEPVDASVEDTRNETET
jgi:periplasmic nitrate reductase NapD